MEGNILKKKKILKKREESNSYFKENRNQSFQLLLNLSVELLDDQCLRNDFWRTLKCASILLHKLALTIQWEFSICHGSIYK